MKPHKWAKEIHAWADGAEIQHRLGDCWRDCEKPVWGEQTEYRIKPQEQQSCCCCKQTCSAPKELQYLYVYKRPNGEHSLFNTAEERGMILVGKIKLEE